MINRPNILTLLDKLLDNLGSLSESLERYQADELRETCLDSIKSIKDIKYEFEILENNKNQENFKDIISEYQPGSNKR